MDNAKAIVEFLATCSEVYNREVSTELGLLWVKGFKDQDIEKLQRAFSEHIDTSSYFPKPADIHLLLNGSPRSQSLAAWTSIIGAVKQFGSYESVRFADPHIVPIIAIMGGWPRLCAQTFDDMIWTEKAFHERYIEALKGHRTYDRLDHLPGSYELGNHAYNEAPLIHLVTMDGSTPSSMPALGQASPDEDITKAVRALATDKGTKGRGEGDQ